jgi:cysteinyl-tRNA synthetase
VALQIFDSKLQSIRAFSSLQAGKVSLYVCGPTVQSAPHVGHLRSAVAFDIVARWLRLGHGLDVRMVRNVTDIDDKILLNATEQGVDWQVLARDVEQVFNEVYESINANVELRPRATDHIADMIELIELLISRGHAYAAADGSGNVFFDAGSWPAYGELTNQKLDNLEGEADASHGRKNPHDFALWKSTKANEPESAAWPSPWGSGRPGWHIECSAMTRAILGEKFDIHGGGLDLRFPHHENELAQSRAAGFEFANYWMHNGLVTVGGQKMSKSLGNGVSVPELFEQGSANAIRYWLGSAHYRTTLDYSLENIADAVGAMSRIQNFVKRASATTSVDEKFSADALPQPFVDAMNSDFGVPSALAALHERVRAGNAALDSGGDVGSHLASVLAMLEVLGITVEAEAEVDEDFAARVGSLIEQRRNARDNKDFALADQIRDELQQMGVTIEDTPTQTTWSLNG